MDVLDLLDIAPWEWPEDSAGILVAALRSSTTEASVKLAAAELAGNIVVMNDELAETLLDVLREPNEDEAVRGRAAISLGPTLEELDLREPSVPFIDDDDDPVSESVEAAIRRTLRDVYDDAAAPKEVRRRALEASVRCDAEWHARAVRAAYYSGDGEWKLTGVFCMGYVPRFEHEVLEALESDDELIRYEAVRAAASFGPEAAWPHIRSILRDKNTDKLLLLAAIEAAASVRPDEAAGVLLDFVDSQDEDIAAAASEALIMTGEIDSDAEEED
jgi:HEAT repeat protein